MLETAIVIEARKGEAVGRELDLLVRTADVEVVTVDADHVAEARRAYRRFGRGQHPAALNFGDVFAYALAGPRARPCCSRAAISRKPTWRVVCECAGRAPRPSPISSHGTALADRPSNPPRRRARAVADDRGFVGVAFRVSHDRMRYENIHIRPDNGRVDDQVRRNHVTQYTAHPDFPFSRMRKEWPERYEAYADVRISRRTRMRVDVAGTTARLFVHDAPQPALVVTDLKLGVGTGGVGLWIGAGTEGCFSNLRIR